MLKAKTQAKRKRKKTLRFNADLSGFKVEVEKHGKERREKHKLIKYKQDPKIQQTFLQKKDDGEKKNEEEKEERMEF
jgi:hypothetical protein